MSEQLDRLGQCGELTLDVKIILPIFTIPIVVYFVLATFTFFKYKSILWPEGEKMSKILLLMIGWAIESIAALVWIFSPEGAVD